jgi:hypothetical protein
MPHTDHTTDHAISCMMTVSQDLGINCRLDKEEQPAVHVYHENGIGVAYFDPYSSHDGPEIEWEDRMPKCSLAVRVLFGTAAIVLAENGYQWWKSSADGTYGWLHCGMDVERTGYETMHECLRGAIGHWEHNRRLHDIVPNQAY